MVKGANNEAFTIYESWNLAKPTVPPRSRLHRLKPIGAGTDLIECLTSFASRLAASHCVSPAVLLGSALAPLMGKQYWLQGGARPGTTGSALSGSFNIHARAINGIGVIATDWVRALEALTLRNDLALLTMLPWTKILPQRNLLRPTRSWCPNCYEDWLTHNQPIYEPLLWTFRDIEICLHHQRRLAAKCRNCKGTLQWLSRLSRPGYCSKCNTWLGTRAVDSADTISNEELRWQSWVITNLQELIVARGHLPSPSRERTARAVALCIENVTDGVMNRFASLIGKRKNTVWGWQKGKSLIPINDLLRLCYSVNLSLVDFVYTDGFLVGALDQASQSIIPPPESVLIRRRPMRFDKAAMERALKTALTLHPTEPMTRVAARLNTSKRFLYKHFPKLCKTISSEHAKYRNACDQKRRDLYAYKLSEVGNDLRASGIYPSRRRVLAVLRSTRVTGAQNGKDFLRENKQIAA
jgi:hypothetical protein